MVAAMPTVPVSEHSRIRWSTRSLHCTLVDCMGRICPCRCNIAEVFVRLLGLKVKGVEHSGKAMVIDLMGGAAVEDGMFMPRSEDRNGVPGPVPSCRRETATPHGRVPYDECERAVKHPL